MVSAFVFIKPNINEATQTKAKSVRYLKILERKRARQKSATSIAEEAKALEEKFKKVEAQFFTEVEATRFIVNELPEYAKKFNVEIQSISIRKMSDINKHTTQFPISISVNGAYFDLISFIANWENFEKLILLDDFSLRSSKGVISTSLIMNLILKKD